MKSPFTIVALATLMTLSVVSAQMDKRWTEGYRRAIYRKAEPTLGEKLPAVKLTDLDGKTWTLDQLEGQPTVLIGGGFT